MHPLDRDSWSATVRERRKLLGLTQVETARLAGCDHQVVVNLEKGRLNVRLEKAQAVLAVLGFTLALVPAGKARDE